MVRAHFSLAAALLLGACGGGVVSTDLELPPGSWAGSGALPPVHHEVRVVPAEDAPTVQPVPHEGTVTTLALMDGLMTVGDASGLWRATGDDTLELAPLEVLADVRDPSPVTGVSVVGQRQSGALLISTPEGIFHEFDGSFFRSPLSDEVTPDTVRSLQAAGVDASEYVWIARDDTTEVHHDGKRWRLRIEGLPVASHAAGIVGSQGFLSVGEDLWMVQVDPPRATLRLAGVGPVTQSRWSNGTLVMATRGGLLEADAMGRLSVTHFEDARGASLPVRGVDHGPGGVHVLAGDHLLRRDGDNGFLHLAELPDAHDQMAVDAWGQIWVTTDAGLVRVRSGERISYSQVEPFFIEHCIRCHDAGFEGAPVINFLNYDVAKEWSPRILARVSDPQSPMPPRRVQVLAPEDWALVKRWVEGGALP